MNKDNFFLGVIAGLVVPILGILMLYVFKYIPQNVSLDDFIYLVKTNKSNIPKVISLGLIACIPLIAYYNNRKRYSTLKGIFLSIMIYALLAVAYKFHIF
ncbi:MAG: hypothetical protein IPL09_14135 [Bacteroidetes bacterium]|jgi:hypothetical protein|nr:hypothetical protein [Bacteroidota bacterium]HQW47072.1 hypothetical protein [Chitinophagaceae bacterium]MBK7041361.1 hypothetical protein [Bacteroidota bacterium]MBK7588928.1 hypothetical protein [Bacteroidota bacterium]MBK8330561.1 hypothetical protein [Bacteroidota bacterium]